jgi:hypothetical protein
MPNFSNMTPAQIKLWIATQILAASNTNDGDWVKDVDKPWEIAEKLYKKYTTET